MGTNVQYGHARFEVALDELALGIFKLPAQNGSSARIIFHAPHDAPGQAHSRGDSKPQCDPAKIDRANLLLQ
jgi:hypothetical protein